MCICFIFISVAPVFDETLLRMHFIKNKHGDKLKKKKKKKGNSKAVFSPEKQNIPTGMCSSKEFLSWVLLVSVFYSILILGSKSEVVLSDNKRSRREGTSLEIVAKVNFNTSFKGNCRMYCWLGYSEKIPGHNFMFKRFLGALPVRETREGTTGNNQCKFDPCGRKRQRKYLSKYFILQYIS